MKGKLKIILPVLLLLAGGGGGAYFFILAPKPAKAAPPKVAGELFDLSPEFVVNLSGGHYGKVSVAFLMTAGAPKHAKTTVGVLGRNETLRQAERQIAEQAEASYVRMVKAGKPRRRRGRWARA